MKKPSLQDKISQVLFKASKIDLVIVVQSESGGTVTVSHERHHGLEFKFHWNEDHFVGYFLDASGNKSQAVISLYTMADAKRFIEALRLLSVIRANQK